MPAIDSVCFSVGIAFSYSIVGFIGNYGAVQISVQVACCFSHELCHIAIVVVVVVFDF